MIIKFLTNCFTLTRSKHINDLKERLFIVTYTHNLSVFGVIPFVKPQNDTVLKTACILCLRLGVRRAIVVVLLVISLSFV